MARNPYEDAPRLRTRGKGKDRVWLVLVAVVALATTVAWAAPQGGKRPTAELTSDSSDHMASADGQVTLTETVTFEDEQPDEECVLSATLHALGDDGSDEGTITVGGKPLEFSARLAPRDGGKVLSLPMRFDARRLAGRSVVCLATLTRGDETVARWEDVQDDAQTVRFPSLSASLGDSDHGSEVLADRATRVKATISYANVEPERAYSFTATLVDAGTGHPLLDGEGRELSATVDDPHPLATSDGRNSALSEIPTFA